MKFRKLFILYDEGESFVMSFRNFLDAMNEKHYLKREKGIDTKLIIAKE